MTPRKVYQRQASKYTDSKLLVNRINSVKTVDNTENTGRDRKSKGFIQAPPLSGGQFETLLKMSLSFERRQQLTQPAKLSNKIEIRQRRRACESLLLKLLLWETDHMSVQYSHCD